MKIDDIFTQRKKRWNTLIKVRKNLPDEVECKNCKEKIPYEVLENKKWICDKCGYYLAMKPTDRIKLVSDDNSFKELFDGLKTKNPLQFPGYENKLESVIKKTGSEEAVITGICKIDDKKVAIGVMDCRFLMGSMGSVVGEKISRLAEYATKKKLPLIIFCASGGARMQEGMFSLLQMANTSAAITRYKDSGGLFISCQTNPTTGGVSASFANLGDIIIAEPGALICFAGPRVIEQTIGQKLPDGFQKAEFLLEHGMIDMIVSRNELKDTLSRILTMHQ